MLCSKQWCNFWFCSCLQELLIWSILPHQVYIEHTSSGEINVKLKKKHQKTRHFSNSYALHPSEDQTKINDHILSLRTTKSLNINCRYHYWRVTAFISPPFGVVAPSRIELRREFAARRTPLPQHWGQSDRSENWEQERKVTTELSKHTIFFLSFVLEIYIFIFILADNSDGVCVFRIAYGIRRN